MASKEIFDENEYDYDDNMSMIGEEDSSTASELSETIKLREELPFTQLEPYASDILKLIIENDELNESSSNAPSAAPKYKKVRVNFKEIHNETIGDIYTEDINIPRRTVEFCSRLPLSIPHGNRLRHKNLRLVDPKIVDLNVSTLLGIPVEEFVWILSFLFFGVFLEDPEYDAYELNLNEKSDEHLSFIIKYFKYRLKDLREEYVQDQEIQQEPGDKDEEGEDEKRTVKDKVLPLLLMLREKVTRL